MSTTAVLTIAVETKRPTHAIVRRFGPGVYGAGRENDSPPAWFRSLRRAPPDPPFPSGVQERTRAVIAGRDQPSGDKPVVLRGPFVTRLRQKPRSRTGKASEAIGETATFPLERDIFGPATCRWVCARFDGSMGGGIPTVAAPRPTSG